MRSAHWRPTIRSSESRTPGVVKKEEEGQKGKRTRCRKRGSLREEEELEGEIMRWKRRTRRKSEVEERIRKG